MDQAGARKSVRDGYLNPKQIEEGQKMTFADASIDSLDVCNDITRMRLRFARLSRQTRRVLDLLIAGHPNKVIAWQLEMPITTVKSHLSVVFRTLGCANRTHASLIAFCVIHDLPGHLALLTNKERVEGIEYFTTIRSNDTHEFDQVIE